MQCLSGQITTSGCASPDLAKGLFQTRQPTQYCEWRNGVYGDDAVCYCGINECNAKEMLENWIQNGGRCKLFFYYLIISAYYLLLRKSRVKFKMHSTSESSKVSQKSKNIFWTKNSPSIVEIEPKKGFDLWVYVFIVFKW